MGIHYLEIPNSKFIYVCRICDTPLAKKRDIKSENFYGRNGPAYLLRKAYNIKFDGPVNREMQTGLHTVRDVFCKVCYSKSRNYARAMGWYYKKSYNYNFLELHVYWFTKKTKLVLYEFAFDHSQRYKEGSIILERRLLKEITGIDEQNPAYKYPGERPNNQNNNSSSENENSEDENSSNSGNSNNSSNDQNDDGSRLPRLINVSRLTMPWERNLSNEDIHRQNFIRFGRLSRDEEEILNNSGARPEQTIRIFENVRRRHRGGNESN